jgi:glycosyltransferase involved in cell wall biosynthesis
VKISICTVTARRGFIDQQLKMIAAQQLKEHTLEWVLVDFAFEENATLISQLALEYKLEVMHDSNVREQPIFFRDITRNRNKALKMATGDVVIFLDDYALIDPLFVLNHLSVIEQGYISAGNMFRLEKQITEVNNLVGKPLPEIITQYKDNMGIDHRYKRGNTLVTQPYKAVGISYTGNLGFSRKVFEELNGFDSRMESGLEDCDFGFRAYFAGFGCLFNPFACTVNLATGHIPYTFSFDHTHDVEPFICNAQNKYWGNDKLLENEFMTIEFKDHYRVGHCKRCGAQGMIDPAELMAYKQEIKQYRVPAGLPGGLDTLRKEVLR